jgi:alpha-L-fucosidase
VKNSSWKNGEGDVVRETALACKAAGIRFGFYLSPWDRHEKTYGDSEAYNEYFKKQLTELLTGYGDITEVWLDGACGEGAGGKKQEYDWEGYYEVIRRHQPDALIAICGPDIRWVGNEDGYASETQWSVQDRNGKVWWPSECDVSIRPGWFYHKNEDGSVKTTKELLDIYYRSVGRNAVLLLNVPPDRRGLINEIDAKRLEDLGEIIRSTFKDNQASGALIGTEEKMFESGHPAYELLDKDYDRSWNIEGYEDGFSIILDLKKRTEFDLILIQENIAFGQRIEKYSIDVWDGNKWENIVKGTTVGYKRINKVEKISTRRVRFTIEKAIGTPVISSFGIHRERNI